MGSHTVLSQSSYFRIGFLSELNVCHFRIKNKRKLELDRKLKIPFICLMNSVRDAREFAQGHEEEEPGRIVLVHWFKASIEKYLMFSKYLPRE